MLPGRTIREEKLEPTHEPTIAQMARLLVEALAPHWPVTAPTTILTANTETFGPIEFLPWPGGRVLISADDLEQTLEWDVMDAEIGFAPVRKIVRLWPEPKPRISFTSSATMTSAVLRALSGAEYTSAPLPSLRR